MSRLPIPGKDSGTWGDILNDYLSQSHTSTGKLKDDIVTAATIKDGTITESQLSTAAQTKLNATAPVQSVASKTGNVTLTKSDVGLNNVNNTSDADKPVSTAVQTALDEKATERLAFPVFVVSDFYGGTLGEGDDTTCIQNTLDAANVAGGGVVILPPRSGYIYQASQLVIPRFVRFSGGSAHTFGANAAVARLAQIPGVNDDFIIFNDNGDASTRPFVGPFGITDLSLRGALGSGATSGHGIALRVPDGRVAGMQDFSVIERVGLRGFPESGIYATKGSPLRLSHITTLCNGGYGIEIEDPGTEPSSGSIHELSLKVISGDGNMGYQSDGGGATVYLKGLPLNRASVTLDVIKSEFSYLSPLDGGDNVVMGNYNAVIIDDCACPINITGVEHIAKAATGQDRKPGNAIQIVGPSKPDLLWSSVTIRRDHPNQVIGSDPYLVYDAISARGTNIPHGVWGTNPFILDGAKITGVLSADSGTQRCLELSPVINQSGTAGYTAVDIDVTESTSGSGTNRLLVIKRNGQEKFGVYTDGAINVGSNDTTIARVSAGRISVEGNMVGHVLFNTATLNFPSISAQSFQDLTITVTGATTGDSVSLGVPTAAVTAGIVYSAWVSVANTVTVRAHNYTSGALDPASGTFKATIVR